MPSIIAGALCLVAAEGMLALMSVSIKAVGAVDLGEAGLPNEMIVFCRSLVGCLLLIPLLLQRNQHGLTISLSYLKTSVASLHLFRALIGLCGMYCYFYALTQLPLAEGMVLKMTSPIFMPLIAFIWLNDQPTRYSLLAIPVGFVGMWLIVVPSAGQVFATIHPAALIGLAGGIAAAGAKVLVAKLGQTEPTGRIVAYFFVLATGLSAIPAWLVWQTPTWQQAMLLIAVGICATAGQLLLTRAYSLAAVSRIAPLTYTSVIFGVMLGWLIWDETVTLRWLAGSLLIIAAGLVTLYQRRNRV